MDWVPTILVEISITTGGIVKLTTSENRPFIQAFSLDRSSMEIGTSPLAEVNC
jgi:hypothetical protein